MSADLSFNAALLGAAAAWVKKPAAQESTGPSSDPVATSAAPAEAGGQARKGGGKQRAGLGHVVEQKKDATKVRNLCCALHGGEHIAHSLRVSTCARTLLPSLGPCVPL